MMTDTILPTIRLEKTPHYIPNLSISGDPSAVVEGMLPNLGALL